jgi:flotillin
MSLAQTVAPSFVLPLVIAALVSTFMMFGLLVVVARQYKRCPSNRVLVIYGRTGQNRAARIIHGGAAFVIPLLQDFAYLSLELIPFELQTKGVRLENETNVDVTTGFTIAIGTEPKVLENAAVRLLGLTNREIQDRAEEIISGPLRQVIAGMTENELRSRHDAFQEQALQAVERKLNEIGLVMASANVREVTTSS